ncbi:MAG: hypothetical protein AAB444_00675 [Patescibacteria group bacterium]|mgnify:CR=1
MLRKFFSAFPFVFGGVAASTFALFSHPTPTAIDASLLRERVSQSLLQHAEAGTSAKSAETPAVPEFPALEGSAPDVDLAAFQRDTDGDGLPDFTESFYDTDARNPDTDGDSYLDGEEVRHGYSPLGLGKLEP